MIILGIFKRKRPLRQAEGVKRLGAGGKVAVGRTGGWAAAAFRTKRVVWTRVVAVKLKRKRTVQEIFKMQITAPGNGGDRASLHL